MHNFLSKTKIPKKIPHSMRAVVGELKKMKTQQQCLARAYRLMAMRYHGRHFLTYLRPLPIFSMDASKLWNKNGFMHCHNMNWLLRILLVKSGFFDNSDIKNRWTMVRYISIHQYLRIKMRDGQAVNVDVWGIVDGVKMGDYAHGL